jgi:hypothetical protein
MGILVVPENLGSTDAEIVPKQWPALPASRNS